jgi:predicted dehydrogenase
MVGVGIVGLGFGKKGHLPAFRACPNASVLALIGRDPARSLSAGTEFSLPRSFASFSEMLADPAIQAVSLALPPAEQPEYIAQALAAGRHVFCEKPLGCGSKRAWELARLASDAGLATAVDFEFPEIVPWQEARRLLQSGAMGKVLHFELHWLLQTYANKHGLHSWKTDAAQGGGTLGNFVSHVFYNLEWLLGPLTALSCRASDQDRLLTLQVELGGGVGGIARVGANTPHCYRHQLEIFCENGILLLENLGEDYVKGFRLTLQKGDQRELRAIDEEAQGQADGRIVAVSRLARRFLQNAAGGRGTKVQELPDLAAGARVEFLLEKAREAIASGRWEGCNGN